ncbi:MAG: hypothetical protein O7C56_06165, partial [Rickettsia endosymbiont of Ixodes persulcatus]|nr:hypothetical protein [Rickettsia endosymbiont of Ixodes persulcatus]
WKVCPNPEDKQLVKNIHQQYDNGRRYITYDDYHVPADVLNICQQIDESTEMTLDEKIHEYHLVGYSRTYDIIGLYYYLCDEFSLTIRSGRYNYQEKVFYEPRNKHLPKIVCYTSSLKW